MEHRELKNSWKLAEMKTQEKDQEMSYTETSRQQRKKQTKKTKTENCRKEIRKLENQSRRSNI